MGRQGLGDFYELLLTNSQGADAGVWGNIEPDCLEELAGFPAKPRRINQPPAARFSTQEQVGGDVEILSQIELLVNEGDSQPESLFHGPQGRWNPVYSDLTAVGGLHPGEDLH